MTAKKRKRKKRIEVDERPEAALVEKATLADEYLDHLKRMKADFENFKKRAQRERSEFIKFANEELIKELLPVIDNFRRAVNHAEEMTDTTAFREGIRLIEKDFEEVLKKRGLVRLETIGANFDPEIHEAIMLSETEDHPDETIIEEVQPGYKLGERLLRPARVVVSKSQKIEDRSQTTEDRGQKLDDRDQTTEDKS